MAPGPALGETVPCFPRDELIALYATQDKVRTNVGLGPEGVVIEVLSSPEGAFTIIVSGPDGFSCIAAQGQAWRDLPRAAPPPKRERP